MMSTTSFFSSLSLRGRNKNSPHKKRSTKHFSIDRLPRSRASSATLYTHSKSSHKGISIADGTDEVEHAAGRVDVGVAQRLLVGSDELHQPARRSRSFTFAQPETAISRGDRRTGDYRYSSTMPLLNTAASLPAIYDGGQSFVQPSEESRRTLNQTSQTWSSSDSMLEQEDIEDREPFVVEFNRLAQRYGLPIIVPDGFEAVATERITLEGNSDSWIMRKLLRRTASVQQTQRKSIKSVKHKRSVSEMPSKGKDKKDALKNKECDELIRLCGQSVLYLPVEYASGPLNVPTCFRATGQYLIQHAAQSRGVFRGAGNKVTVEALYNHYAVIDDIGEVVNGTVRSPLLPDHIKYDIHDVATTFKRFLSGLPKGILGSTWIFDAFVNIYGMLDPDPETTRTKMSRVRARLIAFTIASISSKFQRELLSAVFGILCMLGRTAETAPREDQLGRPLPTSDLMGYQALSVTFGPLLIGELLNEYEVRAPPQLSKDDNVVMTGRSPTKSLSKRPRKSRGEDDTTYMSMRAEKFRLANSVAEMVIVHWRDIVRQMRHFGALHSVHEFRVRDSIQKGLRQASFAPFGSQRPVNWEGTTLATNPARNPHSVSSPTPASRHAATNSLSPPTEHRASSKGEGKDDISVRKRSSRGRPMSSQVVSGRSISIMSPTPEETSHEEIRPKAYLRLPSDSTFNDTTTRSASGVGQEDTDQNDASPGASRAGRSLSLHSLKRPAAAQQSTDKGKDPPTESLQVLASPGIMSRRRGEDSSTTQRLQHDGLEQQQVRSQAGNMATVEPLMDWNTVITPQHSSNTPADLEEAIHQTSQFRVRPPTRIPQGLVSSRVRGIAATDPGPDTQPARCLPPVGKSQSRRYKTSTEGIDLGYVRSQTRDPVARLSREDDESGLASLAEVISSEAPDSQPEQFYESVAPKISLVPGSKRVPGGPLTVKLGNKTLSEAQDPADYFTFRQQNGDQSDQASQRRASTPPLFAAPPNTPQARTPTTRDDRWPPGVPRSQVLAKTVADKIAPARTRSPMKGAAVMPSTPRRTEADQQPASTFSRPVVQRTSVRALAAKFDVGTATPSPSRTYRVGPLQRSEKVTSPYTTNKTPLELLRNSKSDLTLRSQPDTPRQNNYKDIRSPAGQNTPMRDLIATHSTRSSTNRRSARYPYRNNVSSESANSGGSGMAEVPTTKISKSDKKLTNGFHPTKSRVAGPPYINSSELLGPMGGDANRSIHTSSSKPTINSTIVAAAATQVAETSVPARELKSQLDDGHGGTFAMATPARLRRSSQLYTEVMQLKQLLSKKTEEIEYLKRRIHARTGVEINSINNEVVLLSREVRQVKDELEEWRERALLAEKKVHELDDGEAAADKVTTATTAHFPSTDSTRQSMSHSSIGRNRTSRVAICGDGHGTGDSATDSILDGLSGGTVRRGRSFRMCASVPKSERDPRAGSSDFDIFDDGVLSREHHGSQEAALQRWTLRDDFMRQYSRGSNEESPSKTSHRNALNIGNSTSTSENFSGKTIWSQDFGAAIMRSSTKRSDSCPPEEPHRAGSVSAGGAGDHEGDEDKENIPPELNDEDCFFTDAFFPDAGVTSKSAELK